VASCPDYRLYLNCSASAGVMFKFSVQGFHIYINTDAISG
jgi:hypothetical protein